MQHVPKVKNPERHLPNVPYFEDARFEFQKSILSKPPVPLKPANVDDYAWQRTFSSFVQHWLYFGTLTDFFDAWQIPVDPKHFLDVADGTAIITTRFIQEYIVASVIQEHKKNPRCLSQSQISQLTIFDKNWIALNLPRIDTLSKTLQYLRQELRFLEEKQDELHPLVWDSLVILGGTLDNLAKSLYSGCKDGQQRSMYKSILFEEFRFRSIRDIRFDKDWCPRESRIVAEMTDSNPLMLAYIGQLNVQNEPERHKDCHVSRCKAFILDPKKYPETHDSDNCSGSCEYLGYDENEHPTRRQSLSIEHTAQQLAGHVESVDETDQRDQTAIEDDANNKLEGDQSGSWKSSLNPKSLVTRSGSTQIREKGIFASVKHTTGKLAGKAQAFGREKQEPNSPEPVALPEMGDRMRVYQHEDRRRSAKSSAWDVLTPWRARLSSSEDESAEAQETTKPRLGWGERSLQTVAAIKGSVDVARNYFNEQWLHYIPAATFEEGKLCTIYVPCMMTGLGKKLPGINHRLVAISHVWKDGLGNPTANRLPACQLLRIQNLVDGLFPDRSGHIPFYIDTLMIPFSRKNPTPEQKEQKSKAIADMEWAYRYSSKVLVLDQGLLGIKSAERQPEELAAYVLCASWTRRLWTLQEGRGRQNTYYQFQDHAIQFDKIIAAKKERGPKFTLWSSALSSEEEAAVHRRVGDEDPVREKQKIGRAIWNSTDEILFEYGNAVNKLDPMAYYTLNPIHASMFDFVQSTMNQKFSSARPEANLTHFMRSIYYRDLTEHADEPLVLSSLVHRRPGSAATLHRIPDEDRFKAFWSSVLCIPADIIFLDQKRYAEYGCGWMPKTLLSTWSPASKPLRSGITAYSNKEGLQIRSYALLLPEVRQLMSDFHIQYHRDMKDALQSSNEVYHYSIHLREPGTANPVQPSAQCQWAIIPDLPFWDMPRHCHGVLIGALGKIVESRIKNSVHQATVLEAFMDMERIDDEQTDDNCAVSCYAVEQTKQRFWTIG